MTYMQTRGASDRFVTKLIAYFGETPIAEIDQAAATQAAATLYPNGSPASHHRAVFTPLSAIGVKGLKRPKTEITARDIPTDEWIDRLLAVAPPKLGALVIFLTITGRRVGEAIGLKRGEIRDGMVLIRKTKTGKPVYVKIPELCLTYLNAPNPKGYTGGDRSKHLFGYATVASAHVALTKACKRAKIKRYGFHAIGRHSFATRHLKRGKSTKWVKEAGGWDSIRSMDRYLHLEQSEVNREADLVGQEWGSARAAPPEKWRKL